MNLRPMNLRPKNLRFGWREELRFAYRSGLTKARKMSRKKLFKTGKPLAVAVMAGFVLSGCYRFAEPPLVEREMVRMNDTEFGQILQEHAGNLSGSEQVRGAKATLLSNPLVYVVSDDLLIYQEVSEEGSDWDVLAMMRSDHHVMLCGFLDHKDVEVPAGAEVRSYKGRSQNVSNLVSGSPEAMKQLAVNLTLGAPKVCIALPFTGASK